MTKNMKIISACCILVVAFGILLFTAMPSSGQKQLTIEEAANKHQNFAGEQIMVEGYLNESTVDWNSDEIILSFQAHEGEDNFGEHIKIVYEGIKPDNFYQNTQVLVEGEMDEKGVVHADTLQTKCPSKYESHKDGKIKE